MPVDDAAESFLRLLEALRPFLNELVIVGGWAHRLYRYRSEVIVPPHEPLFTSDTDIAIPPDASLPSKSLLDELRDHGFVEDLLGEDIPPVTHYRLGNADSGFYAEFLTPLLGGPGRPGKRSRDTAEMGGVVAQRLRYLDVLLIEPWSVAVSGQPPITEPAPFRVRIPNPVTYIAQKLLVFRKRSRVADRAKDFLYIHDTIELFASSLEQLGTLWQTTIRPRLNAAAADEILKFADTYFSEVTDDIRNAARATSGRELDPETIRKVCAVGLQPIFFDRERHT